MSECTGQYTACKTMSVISTCILEYFSKYKALIYSTSVKITSDFSLAWNGPMGYDTRLTLAMLCTEINPEEKEYHSFLISGNNRKITYYLSDVSTSLCHSHFNCHTICTSHYSAENEVFCFTTRVHLASLNKHTCTRISQTQNYIRT